MRCIRRNQVLRLVVARGILLRLPRYTLIAIFYSALLAAITACSFDGKDNGSKYGTAAAPPPTAKQETIAPIPTAMDTFRALAPPDGLKFTPLFNDNISDTNARIKRLEDAVQTIRNDVDTLVPTMVRMVAIEKDIKGLVAQLQTLTDQNQQAQMPVAPAGTPRNLPPPLPKQSSGGTTIPGEDVAKGTEPAKADEAKAGPVAPSSLVTPEAASKGELPPEDAASPHSTTPADAKPQGSNDAPKTEQPAAPVNKTETAPQPAAAEAPAAVTGNVINMHIADDKDKTQLTLDVTADAPAPVKLIDKDKVLVIDLAHFSWGGKDAWESDHKQLITDGYIKDGKLYVKLKHAAEFKTQNILPPSDDDKNYRLVINLFNKKVQKAATAPKAKAPKAASQTPPEATRAIVAPAAAPAPAVTTPAPAPQPAAPPKATAEDFP